MNVAIAKGRSLWADAEYKSELAKAYAEAAGAARMIDEAEIANRWTNRAAELGIEAANQFKEAKALGYFGEAATS